MCGRGGDSLYLRADCRFGIHGGNGHRPAEESHGALCWETIRVHKLKPLWEYRFEVGKTPITVRLLSGSAERDGTELAARQPYAFANTKSKLLTWRGAEVEARFRPWPHEEGHVRQFRAHR